MGFAGEQVRVFFGLDFLAFYVVPFEVKFTDYFIILRLLGGSGGEPEYMYSSEKTKLS